jgi:hypothetical protein
MEIRTIHCFDHQLYLQMQLSMSLPDWHCSVYISYDRFITVIMFFWHHLWFDNCFFLSSDVIVSTFNDNQYQHWLFLFETMLQIKQDRLVNIIMNMIHPWTAALLHIVRQWYKFFNWIETIVDRHNIVHYILSRL